ncbi:TonB-dependent receptor [Zobellia galactanivorans]|uniref:TonB-dependent receptor n=1 Tax=Zobellia galactanivorans (strain DSM 12802 / CCUG 47099 / CIP 106680 / NCIMB 13871 / Dsij) TaxID=63186 RepID=UPI001C07BC71|nr:TonB-dependent receptor [Zobellia galactanivorans]MBU3026850.1 TonB-dependent receptor [Zobellia galactanivorans]MDO6810886.1 TonB-dependent receptor [Zobellia galactanivorans]
MKKLLFILMLVPIVILAQEKTVSGIVSFNGEPLPGVNIIEKGTSNGVTTDFNGNYEIAVNSQATLVYSYLGFKTQELQVGESGTMNIVLEEDAQQLEGVEVQGFAGVVGRARKRTESVQSIPESVTALNSEGIEKNGINNVTNFAKLVPNLKLNSSQAAGINFLTVRGIPQIRNADAPVAFVIDGVTIPDPSLLNQELFDLALIEIVKGPQGALYGKNAIGGAINIYSKEPVNTTKNNLTLGYGNANALLTQFVSSGAIKKDKVFYRLSTQFKNFDGLLTNEFNDEKVDFSREFNARGQIIARITDNFKASATLQFIDVSGGAAYYSVNPTGNLFVEGAPGGTLSPDPEDGNNVINHDEPGKSDIRNAFGNVSLEYTPGKVKIQSITSYNYVDRSLSGDLDFIPFDDFTQGETAETKTFNQELRLNNVASEGKINWSAGGFYQDIEKPFFQDGLNRDFDLNQLFYGVAADVINTTTTYALFGFIDYKITDKLTASAGFRYDNDTFKQEDHLSGDSFERSNDIIQPKASLSYQATENALIYVNYGRGYRTGGFNPAVTDRFNRDFEDELTDNYELGFKTSMWNNRFILNGSAFYTDFSNQQQYIFDLDTFYPGNYNYDKSKIIGFELDAKLRLTKYLDLLANYGFVDSEITDGGTTGGVNGTATDLSAFNGKKTPFVPQNNFNIGLESSFALTEKVNFDGNINLNSTGKTYWDESNSDAFTTSAYQLLDARASVSFDNVKFTIWGNNILDKQYYTEYVPGSLFGGFDDFGWRGRPATYGASVSINF